jgi:Zinc-binding dehydrogenase/DinB superfamily
MEIRDPQEFLRYFGKVHQRTMNVVAAIPPDKVDWGFRPDKFALGDLVRHIAASNRYIFLEVAKGNRSSYHGCGKEYGASYDEIVAFTERLHREAIETLSHFTAEDLQRRCTTPDGASIPAGGIGARVVLDPIAGRGLPALAQATTTGGTIIVAGYLGTDMFGYVDGQPTPFPFIDAVGRNLNVRGYNAQGLMRDPAAVALAKRYVYDLFSRGSVAPKIDKVFPLSHIEDAYEYLNGNGQIGKIVVVP